MSMAKAPALTTRNVVPSLPNSTSTPLALSCDAHSTSAELVCDERCVGCGGHLAGLYNLAVQVDDRLPIGHGHVENGLAVVGDGELIEPLIAVTTRGRNARVAVTQTGRSKGVSAVLACTQCPRGQRCARRA